MSLGEFNSGTIQNMPFWVNTTIVLQNITIKSDNTSTLVSRNTPCYMPSLPDIIVMFWNSIILITPN